MLILGLLILDFLLRVIEWRAGQEAPGAGERPQVQVTIDTARSRHSSRGVQYLIAPRPREAQRSIQRGRHRRVGMQIRI